MQLLLYTVQSLFSGMSGTVDVDDDGLVSLHHRAVAEWLVSDAATPPLGVVLPAARQTMADAVMAWLTPIIGRDEQSGHSGTFTAISTFC